MNLEVTVTQEGYILSRPDEVQALFKIADPVARQAAADKIADQGVILCNEIDILGGSAPLVMFMWAQMGLKWAPSYRQPPLVLAGGIEQQITKIDVNHPWPNSITVSVDAADYPAFDPAVIPPALPLVAQPAYQDGTYGITSAAIDAEVHGKLKNGSVITEDGKQYTYHILTGGFLNRRWWTLEAA